MERKVRTRKMSISLPTSSAEKVKIMHKNDSLAEWPSNFKIDVQLIVSNRDETINVAADSSQYVTDVRSKVNKRAFSYSKGERKNILGRMKHSFSQQNLKSIKSFK